MRKKGLSLLMPHRLLIVKLYNYNNFPGEIVVFNGGPRLKVACSLVLHRTEDYKENAYPNSLFQRSLI